LRSLQPLQRVSLSRIGSAEKMEKWWAWKDSNLRPADYESLTPMHHTQIHTNKQEHNVVWIACV